MSQTEPLTQNQTKIQELREQNEIMDLAIDLAFKERMYALLKNFDSNPELLLGYMTMHERREAQKLKEFAAKLKERDLALKEQTAERRLNLEERKQTLNEKKFQAKTQDLPKEEKPEPAPAVQHQPKPSVQVNSPTPVGPVAPRPETSREKTLTK